MAGISISPKMDGTDPIVFSREKNGSIGADHGVALVMPGPSAARIPSADVVASAFTWRWADECTILFSCDCLETVHQCLTLSETKAEGLSGEEPIFFPTLQKVVDVFLDAYRSACFRIGMPCITKARWPCNAKWALFLSHDVDQIYDRELFRILADINHTRKVLRNKERGNAGDALLRLMRSVAVPRHPRKAFEHIVEMEAAHSLRSTFFLLEDPVFDRYGGRYRFSDPAMREIGRFLLDAGCELALHGAYHDFNDGDAYRKNAESFSRAFGFFPRGIRNHHLKFSYPGTWQAQSRAGFSYDATYGYQDRPGFKSRLAFPFQAMMTEADGQPSASMTELPLTIMDTTLFRYLGLTGSRAGDLCESLIDSAESSGGLLSLLWHNNFFLEPEYAEWEETYRTVLAMSRDRRPWCATGKEIADWWRRRNMAVVSTATARDGIWQGRFETFKGLECMDLFVDLPGPNWQVAVDGAAAEVDWQEGHVRIQFTSLSSRTVVSLYMKRSSQE
jgi:hypothetical protein